MTTSLRKRNAADDNADAATAPVKATPLPWGPVISCALVLFSCYMSMVMVFPLIPFMVADFFPVRACWDYFTQQVFVMYLTIHVKLRCI